MITTSNQKSGQNYAGDLDGTHATRVADAYMISYVQVTEDDNKMIYHKYDNKTISQGRQDDITLKP